MTMPNAPNRIMRLLVVLCATHCLATPVAWSQEPEAEPETPRAQSEATTESAAADSAQPDTAAPEEETSPFDYEATEQISEDLSVSFPVDI